MSRIASTVPLALALVLFVSGEVCAAEDGKTVAIPAIADRALHDLPSDAELEREGARIGNVLIDNQDVFDPTDPHEDKPLFRLANRWHVETRPEIIRQHLLFQPGDRYSRRVLDESARLLRDLRYLYDARIEPVHYGDGRVDVRVTTRDVWSLNPGISFGRRGGKNTSGFEIEELNLLGTGNGLAVSHKSGIDRESDTIDFTGRRLFGSWTQLHAGYTDSSDGSAWVLTAQRPFYALDTRWAA